MSADHSDVLQRVRAALGRTEPLKTAPVPPVIEQPITRLVHSDIGLPELFATRARESKMRVDLVGVDELAGKLIEFLTANQCKVIGIPVSPLLEKTQIGRALEIAGFTVHRWDTMTADSAYDLDCGITDVYAAVAEVGGLVIRPDANHGRLLSLVPPIHVAILEPKNLLPDLVDLFDRLGNEPRTNNITIITGPSKTADIEGALVTGVHGPGIVQVFILQ